jgi:hypothetical protein
MTSTTPSTTPGPSTAGPSPSTAQITPTSASNNGESSQPKPKPTNPPQSAKPTKGKEVKEEGGGGKGKSAKELKKEKRAALVAARGGGEEGDAPGSSTPNPTFIFQQTNFPIPRLNPAPSPANRRILLSCRYA